MSQFSIDDLKSAFGDLPGEPPAPNRAVAVRRRARAARQRRSAVGAVAVALPVVGLSLFRGDAGRSQDPDVAAPFVTLSAEATPSTAAVPTATPTSTPTAGPDPVSTAAQVAPQPAATRSAAAPTATAPKPAAVATPAPARPTAVVTELAQPTKSTVPVPKATKRTAPLASRTPAPVVQRPGPGLQVRLAASKQTVKVGETVDFTVVWSDTDGIYVGYEMSYGDIGASKFSRVNCTGGVQPSGNTVNLAHAWQHAGSYRVEYAVRTCNGAGRYEDVLSSVVVTVVNPEPTAAATPTPTPAATPTATPTPETTGSTEPAAAAATPAP